MQNLLLLHRHNMMDRRLGYCLLANTSSTWHNCIAFCFLDTTRASRKLQISGNTHILSWGCGLNTGRVNLESWVNCQLLSSMVKEIASEGIQFIPCNLLPVDNRLALILTVLSKELDYQQPHLGTNWQSTEGAISFGE